MDNISKKIETNDVSTPLEKDNDLDINQIAPEDLDSRWLRWKCLECGYLYEGVSRLKVCPKCGNQDPDKFEDAE